MSVVAFLVLGRDGSSTLSGSSRGLSTSADRAAFLEGRRSCDVILIGGRTATLESYSRTPGPLVVLSHERPSVLGINSRAHWWNCTPREAVDRAKNDFGEKVCIEGGVNFLRDLLDQSKVDELRLSITPIVGGENRVDIDSLLSHFSKIEKSEFGDTIFYRCSEPTAFTMRR